MHEQRSEVHITSPRRVVIAMPLLSLGRMCPVGCLRASIGLLLLLLLLLLQQVQYYLYWLIFFTETQELSSRSGAFRTCPRIRQISDITNSIMFIKYMYNVAALDGMAAFSDRPRVFEFKRKGTALNLFL